MILLGIILLGAFIYALFTYCQRRYLSPLASVPIAPANHFLIKYLGLVPPPNDKDTKDLISEFLIRLGQDVSFSPVAVCWSIFGKPLVIVNTLKGIKDVLIDGQTKGKLSEKTPRVQRGDLICLIQNLVFGGKNINNTIGQVIIRIGLIPAFHSCKKKPDVHLCVRTGNGVVIFCCLRFNLNSLFLDYYPS